MQLTHAEVLVTVRYRKIQGIHHNAAERENEHQIVLPLHRPEMHIGEPVYEDPQGKEDESVYHEGVDNQRDELRPRSSRNGLL